MDFADVWSEIEAAAESVRDDATLLTPASRRRFVVEEVETDRIVVGFPDEAVDRDLVRDRFELLYDRSESAPVGLVLDDLSPEIEPYVTVLSLSRRYEVDEDEGVLRVTESGDDEERGTDADADAAAIVDQNPFLRAGRVEPPVPERVHGDLLLLADLLERLDVRDPGSLSTERLADLYVLLSEVQWGANEFRRAASDALLERIGPDGRLHGRFGTVNRTVRERRRPKPDDEVFAVLDDAGIPREWVTGVDPDKLDVVLAVTDVEESSVYDVTERVYVQKTAVDEHEKRSRLQGIKDRLATLETDEADDLRQDVEAIESRLDDLLAAD